MRVHCQLTALVALVSIQPSRHFPFRADPRHLSGVYQALRPIRWCDGVSRTGHPLYFLLTAAMTPKIDDKTLALQDQHFRDLTPLEARPRPRASSAIGHHLANSARGMAFPSAMQPALLGCKWSPLSYAGSSCVGWPGSRKTASRSTTPSNSPLLRIQSLTF
jgi:hypothetical protein